jgi:DNA-binding transcriptional ArsR family regulator
MSVLLDFKSVASILGDASRLRMLVQLMDGRALTAKELALDAGISAATASTHLQRLHGAGCITAARQGRHKYFKLSSPQVAEMLEAILRITPKLPSTYKATVRTGPSHEAMRTARFCYDHLAGRLGTALMEMMLRKRWLSDLPDGLQPTTVGHKHFSSLGMDMSAVLSRRRLLACRCLDWSERRDHLGGALGAALAQCLLDQQWIERERRSRVVHLTTRGLKNLQQLGVKGLNQL